MNILGRELNFQWPVKTAAPRFPANDSVTQSFGGAPNFKQPDFDGEVMVKRVVTSDPREQWFLSLPAKLLPRSVEQIKRAGLGGDLWQQVALENLISDSWPMYRKCAHEISQAISGCKWIVRPYCENEGDEPKKSAVKKAALVRRAMTAMKPDRFTDEGGMRKMVYDLTGAMLSGISVVELQWQKVGNEKLPRASTWVHPRHYTFQRNGRIAIVGQSDVGETLVFNSPRRNKGIGLDEFEMRQKFICAQYSSRSGSALASGLVRPLAVWWSYWIYAREWISLMAQKHGTPFLKAKYKTGMVSLADQLALEARLRDAGPNNYMLMPDTVELDVVPAAALGRDNPIAWLIRSADEAPQYLLLGQTATTSGTPGSLGNDGSRADVKKGNVQAGAEWIGAGLTEQFATAVLEANYGEGETDECPTIEPDFAEVSSPEKQAARWTQLTGMNMPPVLASEFYKENSLTEPKPGDEVVKGGKVTIAEDPKTAAEMAEEQFNQQLGQQVKQAEVQAEMYGQQGQEPGGGGPAQAADASRNGHGTVKATRPEAARAYEASLDYLRAVVRGAEQPVAEAPAPLPPINITVESTPSRKVVKSVLRDKAGRLVGIQEEHVAGTFEKRVVRDADGRVSGVEETQIA